MTATIGERVRLPQVARLGFADGWLLLPPTFLNLKMPVVIVDHAYIGDPTTFDLEPFGTRNPRTPLPRTRLAIECLATALLLRQQSNGVILARASLPTDRPFVVPGRFETAALIVGNTYQLQLSWAALWSMYIGTTPIRNPDEHPGPQLFRIRQGTASTRRPG